MLASTLTGRPYFPGYLAVGVLVISAFLSVYLWLTPYHEIALIREGNTAAAASPSGTVFGVVRPLASAIAPSVTLIELALWASVTCLIQLLTYAGVKVLLPHLNEDIPHGRTASAIVLAAVSVGMGLLNAACLTP